MDKITISKINETWIRLHCDSSMLYELNDVFSFYVPGYVHMPLYKAKVWDGKIRLIDIYKQRTYTGLIEDIKDFCKTRNYEFENTIEVVEIPSIKTIEDFISTLTLPLELRSYQHAAIVSALTQQRKTIISPTASGKSLIIYSLIRYFQQTNKNVLLIVPTKSLVLQMFKDFVDYSKNNNFVVADNTHIIMGGFEKNTNKPITISTWQSIYKLPLSWFSKYSAVIVDECHTVQAKALTSILEKLTEAPWRFGFTGSLNNSLTHQMMIQAVIGPVVKVASTKELMDNGMLSNMSIKSIVLKYNDDIKKQNIKNKYQDEIKFLCENRLRNNFIKNLALSLTGNTLILFTRVETHGQLLFDLLKNKKEEVHYVHGGTEAEDRENIRDLLEKSDNTIVVASNGVFSTGINIKRLNNIIFAAPTKSTIRVLQSIGRGLRKAKDKNHFVLYDIADDLSWKSKHNYTYLHFIERLKIYNNEEFSYKIVEVPIG